MAASLSNVVTTPLGGGYRMVTGFATLSNVYLTGGETMDLSDYLLTGGFPVVLTGGDDGYQVIHNRGTAAAGKLVAYYGNNNAAADGAFAQVANAADLSAVIVGFTAIGAAA